MATVNLIRAAASQAVPPADDDAPLYEVRRKIYPIAVRGTSLCM